MAKIKFLEYVFNNKASSNLLPTITGSPTLEIVDNVDGSETHRTIYVEESELPNNFSFKSKTALLRFLYGDTRNVTDMSYMMSYCTNLTEADVSNFNTSSATNMEAMFQGCSALASLDLTSFDFSFVTITKSMFNGCSALRTVKFPYSKSSVVTDMSYMFLNCSSLTELNISNFKAPNNLYLGNFLKGCTNLTYVNFSGFDTSNVIEMNEMFQGCTSLQHVDVSSFDTSLVKNMTNMFSGCKSLIDLDLSTFNTSKVTNMSVMFFNCTSLVDLNLSSFNVENVTTFYAMFKNCTSLRYLDLSNFKPLKLTTMNDMLYNCPSLISVDLSNFNITTSVNVINAFYNSNNIKEVGFLYSDSTTINRLTSVMPTNVSKKVYYYDEVETNLSQLKKTYFVKYQETFVSTVEPTTLMSVGEVRDELDLTKPTNNKITRVREVVFTGLSETFSKLAESESETHVSFRFNLAGQVDGNFKSKNAIISNLFKTDNADDSTRLDSTTECIGARCEGEHYITLRLLKKRLNEVSEQGLLDWLKSLGESGTPLIVQFALLVPIVETVSVQIKNQEGEPLDAIYSYKDGVISTFSDELNPTLTCSVPIANEFKNIPLKSDRRYTLFYEGETTSIELGDEVLLKPTSPLLIANVSNTRLKFSDDVSGILLVDGDLTDNDLKYFEVKKDIQAPILKTKGKNLLEIRSEPYRVTNVEVYPTEQGFDLGGTADGYQSWDLISGKWFGGYNPDWQWFYQTRDILHEESGFYTFSIKMSKENVQLLGSGILISVSIVYDNTKQVSAVYSGLVGDVWTYHTTFEVQSHINGAYVTRWYGGTCEGIKITELQLEKGKKKTTFEPVKTNVIYTPQTLTLRRSGNVYDEYRPMTHQFIKRIGDDGNILENPIAQTVKSIISFNDSVKYGTALSNGECDLYHPKTENFEQRLHKHRLNGLEDWTKVNNKTFKITFTLAKTLSCVDVFSMKEDVESIIIEKDVLILNFLDTSYISTGNVSVNVLKIWLQTNNVEFMYELKTPVISHVPFEEFNYEQAISQPPLAYINGTIVQTNKENFFFTEVAYQLPSEKRFELPLLEASTDYTVYFEGEANCVDFGGQITEGVRNNLLIRSGNEHQNVIFDADVERLMLIKGDTQKQSISYFNGISSPSKLSVRTIGKNLVPKDLYDQLEIVPFNVVDVQKAVKLQLQPNTTYKFSMIKTREYNNEFNGYCVLSDSNKENLKYSYSASSPVGTKVSISVTTLDDGVVLIASYGFKFWEWGDCIVTSDDMNEEYVEYEPYKETTLIADPNLTLRRIKQNKTYIQDVLDLKKKTDNLQVVIGEITLNGSEEWGVWYHTKDLLRFSLPIPDMDTATTLTVTCDKFPSYGYNTSKPSVFGSNGILCLNIDPSSYLFNDSSVSSLKKWLQENPITVQYPLHQAMTKTVDVTIVNQDNEPQNNLICYKDHDIELKSSDVFPTFNYRLQSDNNYSIPKLSKGKVYTIRSEGEASIATLGGNACMLSGELQTITCGSINLFLTFDSSARNVILIEGDVTQHTIPYFTGTLDTVSPTLTIKDDLGQTNTLSTYITLRSVGDVRDTYDLVSQTFTRRVGDDHCILDEAVVTHLPVESPYSYASGTIELSSEHLSLLPFFEYACRSSNYYQVPFKAKTQYTLKFNQTIVGNLTMGGVSQKTDGNQVITPMNDTIQAVLFDKNLGIEDFMVIKGDVRHIPTPYFRGLQSVTNPIICFSNGRDLFNRLTLMLILRSLPDGTKDELNLVTGVFTQRLDERPYEAGDEELSTVLTDRVRTVYPLAVPKRLELGVEWSEGELNAYEPNTRIYSETDGLKPLLTIKIPTSTLEIIVATLQEKNISLSSQVVVLEEENISTMIAITEVFEMMMYIMPSEMATINIAALTNADTKAPKGGFQMVEVYVTLILKGKKTLDQVPAMIRPKVEAQLVELGALEA